MSRNDKIKKLSNAIRAWRGATQNGVFVRTPQPHAFDRVQSWLLELNLSTPETIAKLKAMTKYEQFDEWIKQLDQPKQP